MKVEDVSHLDPMHAGTIYPTAGVVVVAREGLVRKLFREGECFECVPVGGDYAVVHTIPVEITFDGPILGFREWGDKVAGGDDPVDELGWSVSVIPVFCDIVD